MKRAVVVLVALAFVILPLSAASIDTSGVESDLATLLEGFGSDLVAFAQQSALLGDGIGDASFGGDFPHGSLAVSAGAVLGSGIGGILDQDPSPYTTLNVPGIVQSAISTAGSQAASLYDFFTTFFPYPNTRVAFGLGTVAGVEVIAQLAWWPQMLTDGVGGLAGLSGITFNQLNAGLRVRKVLLDDTGAFPAISLGAGYVYSNLAVGASLGSLETMDVSGLMVDFTNAALSMQTTINSAGLDLTVSKKLLIFVPYLRISSWYQWGKYTGALSGFSASLAGTTVEVSPVSEIPVSALSFLLAGGLGVKLGKFGINLGASYNPQTSYMSAEVAMSGQW